MAPNDMWLLLFFTLPVAFGFGWHFGAKYQEREDKKKEKEREAQRNFDELTKRYLDKGH